MSETRELLGAMVAQLFTRSCGTAVRRDADAGLWSEALWGAVEEAGLSRALAPEAEGGSDLSIADAMLALQVSARFGAPVPLAETMLASWLLAGTGLPIPPGPLTIGPAGRQGALNLIKQGTSWQLKGTTWRIPWARHAARIILLASCAGEDYVISVDPGLVKIKTGQNLAGEPRDDLIFDHIIPSAAIAPALPDRNPVNLRVFGAVMRTVQIAGALDQVLDMTIDYVRTRVQFGKQLAKFQAIQQSLAQLGAQSAAANAAADMAVEGADQNFDQLRIAAAKTRAGEAASAGAAIAHQAHGAMGFTQDYPLHYFTRRLWSWRDEFGRENEWARILGQRAALTASRRMTNDTADHRSSGTLWSEIIAR